MSRKPFEPTRPELREFAELVTRAKTDKAGEVRVFPGVESDPAAPRGPNPAEGPKSIRVRISSDGGVNTFVYDDATGAVIGRVQKIHWEADVANVVPRARIELACVPVELIAEAEIVKSAVPAGEHTYQVGAGSPVDYVPTAEVIAGMLHDTERKRDPSIPAWADLIEDDRAVKTAAVQEVFGRLTPFRSDLLLPSQTGKGDLTTVREVWTNPPTAWKVVPESRHQAHPVSRRVVMELNADGRTLGLKEGGPDFAAVAHGVVVMSLARLTAHGVLTAWQDDGRYRKIDPNKDVTVERMGPDRAAIGFAWYDWDGTRMHDTVIVEAV